MPHYSVSYKDFNPAYVLFGSTDKPEAKDANGNKIVYYRIPLKYSYPVQKPDGTVGFVNAPLYIEGPKEVSKGPATKEYEGGKKVHSIMTRYDLSNSEHERFVNYNSENPGTILQLTMRCCKEVLDRKSEVKITAKSVEAMLENKICFYPIKWKMDENNENPIPGENPYALWKLFRYGQPPSQRETPFYNPGDKNPISWSLLENTEIEHKPIFKIDNITIASGRASIKMELLSTIVLKVSAIGSSNIQKEAMDEAAKDSIAMTQLKEELRKLKEARVPPVVAAPSSSASVPQIVEKTVIPGIPEVKPVPVVKQETAPENSAGLPMIGLPPAVSEPSIDLTSVLNSGPVLSLPGGALLSLP
jgi:hypothetical protein